MKRMLEPDANKPVAKRPKRFDLGSSESEQTGASLTGSSTDAQTAPARRLFHRSAYVRSADVTNFLRQYIMLLESGTPILRSLRSLASRAENLAVKGLINDIALYVEGGNTLWQAFDRHPRYFDSVFVNLIKASEASGTLTTVLRRLVTYREGREMLRKKVRGAMIYPVLLIIACAGALFVITSFVVPVFADFFERADMNTPASTKLLIELSALTRLWWWLPFVLLVILGLVYKLWLTKTPERRIKADYYKLKIPVLGAIIHKNALVEMCRTMGLLLRSGLSMMATLDLTRSAIHNRAVAETLKAMRHSVEQGGSLEEPMRQSKSIPPVVTDMFVTGEESGKVDQIAEQIADIYDEEVKLAVAGLGEVLQPIFTIIVGIAVLILFVSLFLPMITMIDQLGAGSSL